MTTSNTQTVSKAQLWAGRILGTLVTLAFLASSVSKLAHVPGAVGRLIHDGLPEGAILPIGMLELTCLALYLFPRTSILGTFLLTGYIGGAIVTDIIGRGNFVPPLLVGILMFASAYLRHAELRRLVPFRNLNQASQAPDDRPVVEAHLFERGKAHATR
jgi:hypothetical protein